MHCIQHIKMFNCNKNLLLKQRVIRIKNNGQIHFNLKDKFFDYYIFRRILISII